MYESTHTPMTPRNIRRRAYSLMRKCWKTLLLAAVLMSLFGWIGTAVDAHGKHLAQQAYDARKEAFIAENPPPEDKENSEEWAFYIEWMATHMAEQAYDEVYTPWEWLGYGIDLLDLLFTCIIAVRLCRGLLTALRVGECTPRCLLSGWAHTSTVCWLAIQRDLRVLGWSLLPLIIYETLSYFFGGWASVISKLLMLLVAIWATLHYALAEVHLADAPDGARTASDSLRLAVDDADAFGIWQMCKTLWPLAVLFAADVVFLLAAELVPALSIPGNLLDVLTGLLFIVLQYTCYVCIYDEMRQRALAAAAAIPETEGLAQARALAQSTTEG